MCVVVTVLGGHGFVQDCTVKYSLIDELACYTRTRGAAHISPNLIGAPQRSVGGVCRWFD